MSKSGLGNNSGRLRYLDIKAGKIAVKDGEKVEFYGYVEGRLTDIAVKDDEYKGQQYKKLLVNLIDETGEVFQLQMKLDSGYGRAFCCIIPNVDLSKPVRISPTYEEKDGAKKTGMFINQNDKPVKWAFTKDNPGNRPDLEKVKFKGQEMWDNSAQQNFYINLLLTQIKPQIDGSIIPGVTDKDTPASTKPAAAPAISGAEVEDDLPF